MLSFIELVDEPMPTDEAFLEHIATRPDYSGPGHVTDWREPLKMHTLTKKAEPNKAQRVGHWQRVQLHTYRQTRDTCAWCLKASAIILAFESATDRQTRPMRTEAVAQMVSAPRLL